MVLPEHKRNRNVQRDANTSCTIILHSSYGSGGDGRRDAKWKAKEGEGQ
jgi:hypothetical protein